MAQVYCPVDDKPYDTMQELKEHMQKAIDEGDENHIEIAQLEGWDERIVEVPTENWVGNQVIEESRN